MVLTEAPMVGSENLSPHTMDIIDIRGPVPEKEWELPFQLSWAIQAFCPVYQRRDPRLVFFVGDRFESFAAAVAAYSLRIPIAHAYGGETTWGSLDNGWRDCLTAFSTYHFFSHPHYRDRVKGITRDKNCYQLPGYTSLDTIMSTPLFSRGEALGQIGFQTEVEAPYVLATVHPDTTQSVARNLMNLETVLAAVSAVSPLRYIFTYANQDPGGTEMNSRLEEWAGSRENVRVIPSLGTQLYLSLLKHTCAVLGNSSSGVIEAPFFHVPTINIGRRQEGRARGRLVLDIPFSAMLIEKALSKLVEVGVVELMKAVNKSRTEFQHGASDIIIEKLKEILS
jgi:UDP-hydrolysing UDP-N-acetyl-D-glucosamine 2-epimerase